MRSASSDRRRAPHSPWAGFGRSGARLLRRSLRRRDARGRHRASGTSAPPRSEKLYLETMGAGVGWIDYDQDGFLDAFFANSGATPHFKPAVAAPARPLSQQRRRHLHRRDGEERAGAWARGSSSSAWPPATTTTTATRTSTCPAIAARCLYRNNGKGGFEDVTDKAGVGEPGRLGHGGGLVRLRPRRPARPAGRQLRAVRHGAQRRVRRPDARRSGPIATPTASPGPRPASTANNGDGTFADVTAAGEARQPRRQEPGRGPGRPGRRRLDRRLHRQRHPAELRLLQQGRRDLRGRQLQLGGRVSARTARRRRA